MKNVLRKLLIIAPAILLVGFSVKIANASFIQSDSASTLLATSSISVSLSGLGVGNTALWTCSASQGGGPFNEGDIIASTTQGNAVNTDSFVSQGTSLSQWTLRNTITATSSTFTCTLGGVGFRYISVTEFSGALTLQSTSTGSGSSNTSDAGTVAGNAGDLVYMAHFQDYFLTQVITPTASNFSTSTDEQVVGQSKQKVWYQTKLNGSNLSTEVTGWNYSDGWTANAVVYGSTGGQIPPAINILWPQNGTSTPNFSQWYFGINPNSGTSSMPTYYNVIIKFWLDGTTDYLYNQWPRLNSDFASGVGLLGNSEFGYLRTKSITLNNGEIWHAIAYLNRASNGQVLASSEENIFTIDNNATIPVSAFSTSTNPSTQNNAQNTILEILQNTIPASQIVVTNDSSSVVYGICSNVSTSTVDIVIGSLFCPTGSSKEYIQEQFAGFNNTFPFSLFYNIEASIQQTVSASTTDRAIKISNPIYGTLTFLSSSTVVAFIGVQNRDMLFSFESSLAWFIIGFTLLLMVFKHFKQ